MTFAQSTSDTIQLCVQKRCLPLARLSKLLVLSASYGEGHQQAAVAVRDVLAASSPETDVQIMDYMKCVHPILDSVARYCYIKSVQIAPVLYGLFYKGTSQIPPSSLIQRQLNSLGINELAETLDSYRPDVVLSTFPIPAGVVSYLKQQGRSQVPLATIITDHAVHSQWIHPLTDMYFVGSQYVRQGLLARGTPANAIRITGIPIRPIFVQPVDQSLLLQKYQLDKTLPTVLVMGGAYGVMGDILQICEQLFQYPRPLQVLVITGRNTRLRAQLEQLPQNENSRVHIFGFVQEIHEIMAVSDLMLTKAGGLTISEALALQLPMLLYRPIPGQEVQNAKFLVKSGVAVLAQSRRQVIAYLHELLFENPQKRLAMKHHAQQIRRLYAAKEIADGLLDLANFSEKREQYLYQ